MHLKMFSVCNWHCCFLNFILFYWFFIFFYKNTCFQALLNSNYNINIPFIIKLFLEGKNICPLSRFDHLDAKKAFRFFHFPSLFFGVKKIFLTLFFCVCLFPIFFLFLNVIVSFLSFRFSPLHFQDLSTTGKNGFCIGINCNIWLRYVWNNKFNDFELAYFMFNDLCQT